VTKDEILRAIAAERRNLLALLRTLEPEQWETIALPGWRVREVAAHVITLDIAGVTGPLLPVALRHDAERLERWNDRQVPRWANRPITDLLLGLDRWGGRFRRMAKTIPGPLYRMTLPTLWGRAPGGLLIWSRAYDEWVHRHDVRRALGMPDETVDVAPVAEFLLEAMKSDTLPRLQGRTGSIAVSLEGTPLPEWVFDVGAQTAGPAPGPSGPADATISAPGNAFVMMAARRDPWEELRSKSVLRVEGDEALGTEFLSRLWVV